MTVSRLPLRYKIIYAIVLGALLYAGAVFFPEFIFRYKAQYGRFTVYYHSGTDTTGIATVIAKSNSLLQASPLNDIKEQKVFLCRSYKEFTFFNPFSPSAFAVNYPVTQNIFVAGANIPKDRTSRRGSGNQRTLSAVVAHETVHSLLERHLGYIRYKMLPIWKNEGYCDYIARESSLPEAEGKEMLCSDKPPESPSQQYFLYRKWVGYLIDVKKVSHDAVLTQEFDSEKTGAAAREAFCGK